MQRGAMARGKALHVLQRHHIVAPAVHDFNVGGQVGGFFSPSLEIQGWCHQEQGLGFERAAGVRGDVAAHARTHQDQGLGARTDLGGELSQS